MLKKFKENKILWPLLLLLFLVAAVSLGRFIYLEIKKNFALSQDFYFNSDTLRDKATLYRLNNYNGVDNYDIVINMNSIKNNKLAASGDIAYDISINCSSNASCSLSKTSGVIFSASNTDYFLASISPTVFLNDNDSIHMEITATSTSPYEKTLTATFMLVVGNYGLSYEINDEVGRPYLEMKLTNTLDFYTVIEAFNGYQSGERIELSTYMALSNENKEKCASAIFNLGFNPNTIIFDNASFVDGLLSTTVTQIGGYEYVNSLSLKLDAISSKIVRFYKKNKNANYTYPIVNQNPIITVTYD